VWSLEDFMFKRAFFKEIQGVDFKKQKKGTLDCLRYVHDSKLNKIY